MPKLVLIADDHDDAARLMAEVIEMGSEFVAVAALDGVEAIAKAEERRPDIAVLDIDMPHIGGLEAARLLRMMFPSRPPLLIACTGRLEIDEVKQSGMFDHVLNKPVGLDELLPLFARGRSGTSPGGAASIAHPCGFRSYIDSSLRRTSVSTVSAITADPRPMVTVRLNTAATEFQSKSARILRIRRHTAAADSTAKRSG